jgi:hypothetical protein
MSLRQAWYYNTDSTYNDGSDYFLVPSDCNVIWVTGCGGGGGGVSGRTQYNGVGGGGGSASPAFLRYPLAVKPNGIIGVHIGRGAAGGGISANGNGGVGSTEDTNFYLCTTLCGDLIGPEIDPYIPSFALGYAESQTGPRIPMRGFSASSGLFTFTPVTWPYTSQTAVLEYMGAFSSGEDGGAIYSDSASAVSNVARYATAIGRVGAGGTWGIEEGSGVAGGQCAGDFAAGGTKELGGGGAGGASIFGTGGAGGVGHVNSGFGGNGQGYGSGGGGGTGGRSFGGNGGWGFLLIEY